MLTRKTWALLFWVKVLFACCFSCTALAFLSLRVYTKFKDASINNKPVLDKIDQDANSAQCQPLGGLAINEQPDGSGSYIGYDLDWALDTPTTITTKLGYRAAIWNGFIQLDPTQSTPYNKNMIKWYGSEVQKVGGILLVTIEPVVNMSLITDDLYDDIAELFHDINFNQGVPCLLRYGHEMNGDWTAYGYDPVMYIPSFQKMADAIHSKTNMTGMVWSPNVGINYPFTTTSDSTSPPPTDPNDPNFKLLDTNHDGKIDFYDDPYTPYYPGDEYVDWTGLSLYYYQDDTSKNNIPSSQFMVDYLTGSGPAVDAQFGGPIADYANATARNFYQNFPVNHNKPMMLSESGAPYMIDVTSGADELEVKQAWWEQTWLTSVQETYPLLKAILNFEETKREDGVWKTWSLTNHTDISTPYINWILSENSGSILFANNLEFSCRGSVEIVE